MACLLRIILETEQQNGRQYRLYISGRNAEHVGTVRYLLENAWSTCSCVHLVGYFIEPANVWCWW